MERFCAFSSSPTSSPAGRSTGSRTWGRPPQRRCLQISPGPVLLAHSRRHWPRCSRGGSLSGRGSPGTPCVAPRAPPNARDAHSFRPPYRRASRSLHRASFAAVCSIVPEECCTWFASPVRSRAPAPPAEWNIPPQNRGACLHLSSLGLAVQNSCEGTLPAGVDISITAWKGSAQRATARASASERKRLMRLCKHYGRSSSARTSARGASFLASASARRCKDCGGSSICANSGSGADARRAPWPGRARRSGFRAWPA